MSEQIPDGYVRVTWPDGSSVCIAEKVLDESIVTLAELRAMHAVTPRFGTPEQGEGE